MDAPEISLGGTHSATLIDPSPLAVYGLSRTRDEIDRDGKEVAAALGAAALYLCWPSDRSWPSRPRPRAWRIGVPLLEWGAEVFDGLRRSTKGTLPLGDLFSALTTAHRWALQSMITEEEVKAAEDFSEPPQGG